MSQTPSETADEPTAEPGRSGVETVDTDTVGLDAVDLAASSPAAPDTPVPVPRRPGGPRIGARLSTLAAAALYAGLAGVAFLHAWTGGLSHTMPCGCFDQAQSAWFLSWVPFALSHGHNPLFTTWLDPAHGVNLMDNASMPLVGLVFAPVTVLFGPVASWNVVAMSAMAGSALATFCVVRRYAPWWPAAFLGGAIFGFGPYMEAEGPAHLNLSITVLLPVMLWLVDAIVVRQAGRPWRIGIVLGLVCAAQVLVSTELLLTTALMVGLAIVALALSAGRRTLRSLGQRARWALQAAAVGAAVTALLAAYPLWMTFAGPRQVAGHETSDPQFLGANLLGFVLPSSHQLLTVPATPTMVDRYFVGGFLAENGTYLGIPLLVVALGAAIWLWRRELVVRVAALVGVVAAVLSLGSRLYVGNHRLSGPVLPYEALHHLPLFSDVIPARLAAFVDLAAALLFAVALDRAHHRLRGRRDAPPRREALRVALRGCMGASVAVVVLALLPAWPLPMQGAGVPAWFTSRADLAAVPAGSVADVYPFPRVTQAQAMLWQAAAAMRFKMLGGFALIPGAHGQAAEFPVRQGTTEIWFGVAFWLPGPFVVRPDALRGTRAELAAQHVQTVVIARVGADPAGARALVAAALGTSPRAEGGVWVFEDVQGDLRRVAGGPPSG